MQKNPRFDSFLQIIQKCLNQTKFTILISILTIEEITGMGSQSNNIRHSFIQNKFIKQVLLRRSESNQAREFSMVNKMVENCIGCLSQILRLGVQSQTNVAFRGHSNQKISDQTKFLDNKGVKLYYISGLTVLHELKSQLFET